VADQLDGSRNVDLLRLTRPVGAGLGLAEVAEVEGERLEAELRERRPYQAQSQKLPRLSCTRTTTVRE
jgi:hypothetical protein